MKQNVTFRDMDTQSNIKPSYAPTGMTASQYLKDDYLKNPTFNSDDYTHLPTLPLPGFTLDVRRLSAVKQEKVEVYLAVCKEFGAGSGESAAEEFDDYNEKLLPPLPVYEPQNIKTRVYSHVREKASKLSLIREEPDVNKSLPPTPVLTPREYKAAFDARFDQELAMRAYERDRATYEYLMKFKSPFVTYESDSSDYGRVVEVESQLAPAPKKTGRSSRTKKAMCAMSLMLLADVLFVVVFLASKSDTAKGLKKSGSMVRE